MGAIKPNNYSNFEQSVALGARALNHPCRVKMMDLIWENQGITSTDLVRHFKLSKTAIREHVVKLKDAGFVEIEYTPHCYLLYINTNKYQKFQTFTELLNNNSETFINQS